MTDLELAAVSFVAAKKDFDAARYAFKPWRTYELAYRRLRAAVEAAEKATSE